MESKRKSQHVLCKTTKVIIWLEAVGTNVVQPTEGIPSKGYTNNDDCPCVFIKKSPTRFCIISVYVDDLNIIGSPKDIKEARNHIKMEFEMKDLGKTKYCLGLQLEHRPSRILVHQSAYI